MSHFAKRFVYLKNVKKNIGKTHEIRKSKIFKKKVARVKFTRVV